MASKTTKERSLDQMSKEELLADLHEKEESYFRLRFRHQGSPLKNPMQIRTARRYIARLKTILRQKEVMA